MSEWNNTEYGLICSDFKKAKIKDIAIKMADAPFGSSIKNEDYVKNGVLVVQGNNIQGRKCDWSHLRFVNKDKYDSLPRSHCYIGDLIFPKVGTIGKVGILTRFHNMEKYILSTNTMMLRVNPDIANQEFVYYFFSSKKVKDYIQMINPNSVQPVFNFTSLKNFIIYLPALFEQTSIVQILGNLDTKIDLLNRQNKTLEALAETLFRQWFIEEADESWEVTSLSEIVTHHKEMVNPSTFPQSIFHHYSLPAFDDGKVPQKEEGKEILSGKYRVIANSILVSKLNPRTPRIWALFGELESENAICSTEFQIVKPNNITWFSFIYCFLKSYQVTQKLIGASSGTSGSHQRVNPQDILNLTFQKPPEKLVIEYYDITKELFSKINSNFLQIRTLTQLRDTLLPKLMSGEVRVEG